MAKAKPALTTQAFYEQFCSFAKDHHSYLIAYSGGLDSHVLLHLFASIAKTHPLFQLRSFYVDHGLQEVSAGWADHCQQVADDLDVEHQSVQLDLVIPSGESLEAIARKARYQALQKHLQDSEVLLTAHHQDDQAETLLLQLLRGSGLDGLAAMPMGSKFGAGYHFRPLLNYSRKQLEEYAKKNALKYITDPTNKNTRFDRNYLRNTITPLLKQRWPQMGKTLSRSAKLQGEASSLLASLIEKEMPALAGSQPDTLSVIAIKKLPYIQQKAVLRHWIKQQGFIAPSAIKLKHIIDDVLNSGSDSMPLITWQSTKKDVEKGAEIRRYKNDLYIMSPLPKLTIHKPISWDLKHSLTIDPNLPALDPNALGDLKSILLQRAIPVTVCFRQGGERLRPEKRQHSTSLKKLFQEKEIPPWLRSSIPLIYANNQLICVLGLVKIDKSDLKL